MKRIRINWAIPGLLGIIIVIAAVAWIQTQTATEPDPTKLAAQCATCHVMDTHVTAWKDSAHKDVACTACHADKGVAGWVHQQVGRVEMALNKDTDLSKMAADVPNERCLACHAQQMPLVMQDLKPNPIDENGQTTWPEKSQLAFLGAAAGHDVHLTGDKPLKCTDCHSGVSHGPAPTNVADHAAAMHQVCLDCHARQNVAMSVRNSVSCSACHVNLEQVAPDDHKAVAFRDNHGKSAVSDPTTCQNCHLNPGMLKTADANGVHTVAYTGAAASQQSAAVPQIPAGALKAPPGMKDECASCHGLTMPHPQDWLGQHAQGFQEKPELCASCHGTRDQGFTTTFTGDPKALPTTNPSCTGCHAQPMPHPAAYVNNGHAQAAQAAPATCEQCHSPANKANPNSPHATASFCQDCHLSKFAHPSGYVFQHQDVLARAGNDQAAAGCTQCHTPTNNNCTKCHTGGVNGQTQWHPADWTITHKETLAKYGNDQSQAGCTQCHGTTPAQNACTTCHTNGVTGDQQWHPANWVGAHKDTLAASGNNPVAAGCTKCHPTNDKANTTGLSCTACHKNGTDTPTQWHPANWWVTHAQTTKPSDAQSCNKCHSSVEPSCTKCHTGF